MVKSNQFRPPTVLDYQKKIFGFGIPNNCYNDTMKSVTRRIRGGGTSKLISSFHLCQIQHCLGLIKTGLSLLKLIGIVKYSQFKLPAVLEYQKKIIFGGFGTPNNCYNDTTKSVTRKRRRGRTKRIFPSLLDLALFGLD